MGLVLDTSALVAVERAGPSYSELLASLAEEEAVVPAIVVAELLAGVRLAGDTRRAARRQAKIDALLAAAPVIDFGAEIAELWADCFAALERAGNRIPPTTSPWPPRPRTWASRSWSDPATKSTSAGWKGSRSWCWSR